MRIKIDLRKKDFRLGDIIQGFVFCVLALTAIISYHQFSELKKSNIEQKHFNQLYLRPWISITPVKLTLTNDTITIICKIKNHGLSPAADLKFYSELILNNDIYISDSLRAYAMRGKNTNPKSIIFSNDSLAVPINRLIPISEITVNEYYLAITENRLFLHLYVDYWDVATNHLGFQVLLQMKVKKISPYTYDPDYYPIFMKNEALY